MVGTLRRAIAGVGLLSLLASCDDPPLFPNHEVCDQQPGAPADDVADFPRFPGDGAQSVPLPDGRVLWLLGDSILGDGKFIHNLAYVQTGACFRPLAGPDRTEWIPSRSGHFYWPTDAVVEQDVVRVYALEVGPNTSVDGGAFDFAVVDVDVAILRLPDLTLLRMEETPATADPIYGAMAEGQYVYGTRYDPAHVGHSIFVARTGSPWTYWNGVTWDPDPAAAAPIITGADAGGSIDRATGQYRITAKVNSIFSSEIAQWTSPNPAGPWTKKVIASVPLHNQDEFSYFATSHPEQRLGSGQLLVSWNRNTRTTGPVDYGPHYLSVPAG